MIFKAFDFYIAINKEPFNRGTISIEEYFVPNTVICATNKNVSYCFSLLIILSLLFLWMLLVLLFL